MQALVFGDLHGRIRAMYAAAQAWERSAGRSVEVILQVGDFGIYPRPETMDPEKVKRYGHGDYAALLEEGWRAPVPTYFCKGNNEDFEALTGPLPPGLHWVPDGEVRSLGASRVAFLGGVWAPKSYAGDTPRPSHIARAAVERLFQESFDILICHEAPAGTWFSGRRYPVGAPPLRDLIQQKQPRLVVHGHHHLQAERMMGNTRVVALDLLRPRSAEDALLPIVL